MPTISIRVSDDLKARLDSLCQENDKTLSSIIVEAITAMIGEPRTDYPEDLAPYTLSSTNRLILRNQEYLLSKCAELDKDERRLHAKNVEVLESGYASEYTKVFYPLYPEIPYSLCEELYDLLGMFRVLRFSYNKLSDEEKEQIDEYKISFRGFDYNESTESRLADFADYLFRDKRFTELKEPLGRFSDDGNSHEPCLEEYRRMYRRFTQIWRSHLLTARHLSLEEIKKIATAAAYNSGY